MVEWALLNSWCLSHRPPESSDAACSWSLRRFSMLCPPEASIQRRLYNDGAFSGPFALLMRYFISEWRLRFPRSLYTSSVWRLDYRLQCLCRNVMELKYGEGGKGTHSKQQRTIQYRISEFEIWLLIWILKYVIWQLCLIDYWTPLRLLTARISIQQLIRSSSVVWSECAPHCPLESPLNELSLKRPRMFFRLSVQSYLAFGFVLVAAIWLAEGNDFPTAFPFALASIFSRLLLPAFKLRISIFLRPCLTSSNPYWQLTLLGFDISLLLWDLFGISSWEALHQFRELFSSW